MVILAENIPGKLKKVKFIEKNYLSHHKHLLSLPKEILDFQNGNNHQKVKHILKKIHTTPRTPQYREKMSITKKVWAQTEDGRNKIFKAVAIATTKRTAETYAKIVMIKRLKNNYKISPETRAKLSITNKKRHALRHAIELHNWQRRFYDPCTGIFHDEILCY